MPEAAFEKGRRYLQSGRFEIKRVDGSVIDALCKGDSGVMHRVGFDGRWYCTCPARGGACSHLVGLRLVTLEPTDR